MKRLLLGVVMLALSSAQAQLPTYLGLPSGSIAPTCSPGGPTGQMDFSVCSNVGITAALW